MQSNTTLKFLKSEQKKREKLAKELERAQAAQGVARSEESAQAQAETAELRAEVRRVRAELAAAAVAQHPQQLRQDTQTVSSSQYESLQQQLADLTARLTEAEETAHLWRTKHDQAVEDRQHMVEKMVLHGGAGGVAEGAGVATLQRAHAADRLQRELNECRRDLGAAHETIRRLELERSFSPGAVRRGRYASSQAAPAGAREEPATGAPAVDAADALARLNVHSDLLRRRLAETDPRHLNIAAGLDVRVSADDLVELR